MVPSRQPLTATDNGVLVTIRVTPRARRDGVDGTAEITGPRVLVRGDGAALLRQLRGRIAA